MTEYKINEALAKDVIRSISNIKMSEFSDKTVGEFMVVVRSSIGMSGLNTLDESREYELIGKIEELESKLIKNDKAD